MAEYTAPEEIKSESHVALWIYAFDFFFILIYVAVAFMMRNIVVKSFRTPYMIISVIWAVVLTIPSPYNKKRRIFQTLLIFFHKDKNVYRSLTGKENLNGKR